MRLVGVDPGSLGALALLDNGRLVDVADMPIVKVRRGKTDKSELEPYELAALLRRWQAPLGVIEAVGGMTGQSASAAFNFGRAAGGAEYTMTALGMRIVRVAPITWKKALGLRGGKDDSRLAAMRLWPDAAGRFARKKDDGRAESALVAHWFTTTPHYTGASENVFD